MKIKVKNPWKVLSSKEVYKGPFLKLRLDKVITPEGKRGEHVLLLGGRNGINGVAIAALTEGKEIFLVQQYRYAYEGLSLECIGGSVSQKEAPLKAAKRELLEEANLTAKDWAYLGEVWPFTEGAKMKTHLFLAQSLISKDGPYLGENGMKLIKIPLSKAVEKVIKGEVLLTSSAFLILKVSRLLGL